VSQKEPPVPGAVLPADVDRDVLPPEPRARGVANLPPTARGVADDLRQQVGVVPIVVELAQVGREYASGLVPDFTRHAPLSRVAGPHIEDLVGQDPRGGSLPLARRG